MPENNITASIVICTRNRAAHLQATMESIGRLHVPEGLACELLIVDNASTDQTPATVQECRLPNMATRYVCEQRPGKSNGLNTALAAAQGRILLFTDDDVRPPLDWVPQMCDPILQGKAHAVSGGVHTAPHLIRSWMTPEQRGWLVSSEFTRQEDVIDPFLIGANMSFSREVLAQVPAFDPELGPGAALGSCEEALFSLQLREAGYKIVSALHIAVEHHFDESRISRASFVDRREREGVSAAYIAHHWEHFSISLPHLRLAKHILELAVLRALRRREFDAAEGCPGWEMELIQDVSFYRQYLIERRRPRNYTRHGLIKRAGNPPTTRPQGGLPLAAEGSQAS